MTKLRKLGVSEEAINQLEESLGFRLPLAYRRFLLEFGVSGTFVGTRYEFRFLEEMQREAADLLLENGMEESLLDDYFVFAIHQGYQISCFRKVCSDDPDVYIYTEGDEGVTSMGVIFSVLVEKLRSEESKYYDIS